MRNRRFITVLDKMLVLDLGKTFLSVLSVVVAILVSRKFIDILSKAVEGRISEQTVLAILGLKTLLVIVSFLPVAMFIAILMVLGRMYRDQEMAALASAGVGIGGLYRGVFLLVVPLALLTAYLGLVSAPWAEAQIELLMNRDEQSADLRGIAAGRFAEYSYGDLVFYTEDIDADNAMRHVFVQDKRGDSTAVLSAAAAEIQQLPGGTYMVFKDGERLQGLPGNAAWVVEKFAEYAVRLKGNDPKALSRATAASSELFGSTANEDIAELQQRFSAPLGVLLLSALAVPLARISPRSGVYRNLLVAFLIYFIYGNLQRFNQSWVMKGSIPPGVGYVWIYVLMLLVLLGLLVNLYGRKWFGLRLQRKVRW